ncbi:hypothetical protein JQ628_27305 [Bradyrhizobium lablabi]|uniref:hypothetical protein n=1 Tax=Bradyrhizobium lablabi TaxID=722472 RepID=UPI001BAB8AC6|nr:hypothetical protein [Bradyrhizobium lablabi]MBR1125257.1 hypothetical protein [Bradyrhizobium lablabi]
MASRFLVATAFSAALFVSAAATADPLGQPQRPSSVPQAPIGHLQPRAPTFTPNAGAEQEEQDKMTNFDAEQHKLDMELDKSLNICRC